MSKTFIDITRELFVGKEIMIYTYDSYHKLTKRRIQHYYLHDEDYSSFYNEKQWEDVQKTNTYLEILDMGGGYEQYEGNDIGVTVKLPDGKTQYISLEVDNEIDIKEFCYHNGKYTLDKDDKCCKCRLPLKKGIKGIRIPLKPREDEDVSIRKIVRCEDPMVCLRGCSVHEQTCKHPIYGNKLKPKQR